MAGFDQIIGHTDVVEHLKKEYGDAGKTAPIYHAKSRPNLAEAEAVREDENEGLQKQRVFEPLTAEDAQD